MPTLVLIGPPGAGKSTVGLLVADHVGAPFVEADEVCPAYYAEIGWSVGRLMALAAEMGFERAHLAWEEALTHAVERLLAEYRECVIALGAGHTHVSTKALYQRVRIALEAADLVVLLRPDPDPDLATTLAELRKRCIASKGQDWIRDGVDWLHRWSTDGQDDQLATDTVYTRGESPLRSAARVADRWWGVGSGRAPCAELHNSPPKWLR